MPTPDLQEVVESLPPTMRVVPFGLAIGCSERTVHRYIQRGMPTVGSPGHARIVIVRPALAWLQGAANKRGRPRNISLGTKSPD